MKSRSLRIEKLSTWVLLPALIAFAITLLVSVPPLSHSAAEKRQPSVTAGTDPHQKGTRGMRKAQANATSVLVNNPATDQTPGKTQNNASIVAGSGGNLVSVYNDSGSLLSGTRFSGFSRSTDMGATWTDGSFGFNEAGFTALASDKTTGRVYFSALRAGGPGSVVSRSTDNGATWSDGVPLVPPAGTTTDRPWMAVDNFAGPGNQTLYLSFITSSDGIRLWRSTDLGVTFTNTILLPSVGSPVSGSSVAVAPDHSVHIFWLDQSAGTGTPNIIKERRSTDSGATFTSDRNVTTLQSTQINGSLGDVGGFRTNSFPQAAVNPVNGDIYVVYNDGSAGDSGDIYLQQSTDAGATWVTRSRVNTDATNHLNWQPTLAVTPDGTKILIAWYDRRNDPNDSLIEYFGRVGTISGHVITLNPDFPISDSSFPAVFGQDSLVDPVYMGDYDQMYADNSAFYAVWGDNRLNTAPDVRFSKICTSISQCPANIVVSNDQGQCGAVATYSVPGCGTIVLGCSPDSGSFFPVGTTTVSCATTAGPMCSFTVTVNDTQPPTITCPTNVSTVSPQTCPISSGGPVVFAPPTVSDNCPGVTSICNPPSGSIFPVGTTTVTCTATDASGNTASCSFAVTMFTGCLQDDTNPANVVLFNAASGQYRFCCGGTVFSGVGTVVVKGCTVTIQHNPVDRRVLLKFDGGTSVGSASLQAPAGTVRCTITDRNTRNNTCTCQ